MNSTHETGRPSGLLAVVMALFSFVLFVSAASAQGFPDGSIVKAFVRPGSSPGTNDSLDHPVPFPDARGTLLIEKKNGSQRFKVIARHIPLPAEGLGVFVSPTMNVDDFIFVNVMSLQDTNEVWHTWQLDLQGNGGAPPLLAAQLGIADVNQLVGKYVIVADENGDPALVTKVTPLVPNVSALSWHAISKLEQSVPPRSPKASGAIRVKYNAKTGASLLRIQARGLAKGNDFCVNYVDPPQLWPDSGCPGENLIQGSGFVQQDTSAGQDLPFGIHFDVTTIGDLEGVQVFIYDAFGEVHLSGRIPGCPKKKNCPTE